MKTTMTRSEDTFMSDGKERTRVTTMSRISFAPLSSRRMRMMRRMRMTRSKKGGTGSHAAIQSWASWSRSETATRKKSKRHQPSAK